ncbi:hypothetical protein FGKAn22_15880 [Ferrigenium kumadai]|uniref:Alpha/beta hydrolase n=1 Tax=Ferrigenium kumadai TaxID=1682490 RepID=A0AAN1SZD6_9PROT|nr:hypothetical protein [Ferrigenium kumadai]BBI99895.1 hypothetical protein FGKAn22_15880 [Ferrigenium kumadai]
MSEPTVIIHGWSDDSASFINLASVLRQRLGTPPITIRLADWLSMQNDVTYADLAVAMQRAWSASGLPTSPRSVNVVVHSTGTLVTRDWMTKYFTPESVPIKRFLMLAPANFGSPLAHKGRSFIGRVIKGWGQPDFQTGTQILKGLELGSPYTFNLAERDLFDDQARWYGRGRILGTVLVGNTGYSGVAAIANEEGSDGTVRISTANLNASKLEMVLDEGQRVTSIKRKDVNGSIAFGILEQENHSTITLRDEGPRNPNTVDLIIGALTTTDDSFSETGTSFPWQTTIDATTVNEQSDRFQNTVTYLRDDLNQDVRDYFVEFYRKGKPDEHFEKELYERFIDAVHPYEDNPAYRSMYLNLDELDDIQKQLGINNLFISLTAQPLYNPPKTPVGYLSLSQNQTGGLKLSGEQLPDFFKAHRTLLIDITITRKVGEKVFRINAPI